MKKLILLFNLVLLGTVLLSAQTETEKPADYTKYTKDKGGIYYVVIPVNEGMTAQIKKQVTDRISKHNLSSLRVSNIIFEPLNKEHSHFLVIRRFEDQQAAKSFKNILADIELSGNSQPVIINQHNYRTFLKRKDIGEYVKFISN